MGKKNDGLDIGNRMKEYEKITEYHLTRRVPVIIRVDGRAFHTITRRRFGKQWSMEFVEQMREASQFTMKDIQGCNFCYSQSDEVSFLLTDYKTIRTDAWFDYDLRKIISISASLMSSVFSRIYGKNVCFDSRAWSIPQDEVCNYFIWRQIDATRNAIQMAGREYFSHKQLENKCCNEIQEMLFQEYKINFNDYSVVRKRGFCITRFTEYEVMRGKYLPVGEKRKVDFDIPIFTQNRRYIEQFIDIRED